ncbi:LLM class flavin-dependent oxidoreductase [Methylomicrobium album]|uniref:Flavin-dependent oxidoreductase, F420-dependent methylene-tetrahydromethanopterin reductase n=1 Tax=Methylomicrobium album BG8 TaxID=686340 RepID=H8GIK5_METAL|nr:LLM class flavin-dependent oxidoreductase [Methylomicrobium album]EIC29032.1 flavin-dependent oxidoreductase, F420-dependent methylene-tetrahydromethanopterin reductase [Methylomicrobium album BG8]
MTKISTHKHTQNQQPIDRQGMVFGLSGSAAGFESSAPAQWPALAKRAERQGFHSLWLNEEHFQTRQKRGGRHVLSPLVVAAAMAARTRTIRLGFSLLLLPLHQPIRLAEELASLDCLSRGRVDFGVSRGGSERYLQAFGVDNPAAREQFPRALQQVLDCWADRPLQMDGSAVDVQPKPVQKPHPPVYIGTYSEDLARWAGAAGHRLIIHGIQSAAHARDNLRWFVEAGGDPATVPFGRFTYVAESDAAAERELLPILPELLAKLRNVGQSQRAKGVIDMANLEPRLFIKHMVVAGSPATCRERIEALRESLGIRHFNLLPAFFGCLPPAGLQRSLNLFAEEVMPSLCGRPPETVVAAGSGRRI